jgi:hypothetical protein
MLQFMQPAIASRDAIGNDRLARRDEARRHATAESRDRRTQAADEFHRPQISRAQVQEVEGVEAGRPLAIAP